MRLGWALFDFLPRKLFLQKMVIPLRHGACFDFVGGGRVLRLFVAGSHKSNYDGRYSNLLYSCDYIILRSYHIINWK